MPFSNVGLWNYGGTFTLAGDKRRLNFDGISLTLYAMLWQYVERKVNTIRFATVCVILCASNKQKQVKKFTNSIRVLLGPVTIFELYILCAD